MSTEFFNDQWRIPSNENQNKISNYSMDFDGTSAEIDLGISPVDLVGNSKPYSVSAWVYIAQSDLVSGTNYFIIGAFNPDRWYFRIMNSYVGFGYGNTVSNTSLTQITGDQWNHIVFTFDLTTHTIYINGVSKFTLSSSGQTIASNNAFIGALNGSSGPINRFKGKLDQLTIFDYALSQDQVTQLGAEGYAFNFIPNDKINVGNNSNLNITGALTVSIWMKTTSTAIQGLISKVGSATTRSFGLYIYYSNGISVVQSYVSTDGSAIALTGKGLNAASSVHDGNWHHILMVNDPTTTNNYLYVDGVEVKTTTNGRPLFSSTVDTNIGFLDPSYRFDGELSNAQIFNSVIPPTGSNSVQTIYNNGKPLSDMSGFTSLKGWWKLDENAIFNSTSTEWSVDNNSYPSTYKSSLDFDGSNDYIDCGNGSSLDITGALSISFWIYGETNLAHKGIVSKCPSSGSIPTVAQYHIQYQTNNTLRFVLRNFDLYTGQETTGTVPTVDLNIWQHITMTWNGTNTMTVYKNGLPVCTKVQATTNVSNASPVLLGLRAASGFLNGKLSNTAIWNTELTSTQITTLYNNGTPASDISSLSPVSWWKLDNTTIGIQDSGSASNNGTNNGATEYPGFVNVSAGDSVGMDASSLVASNIDGELISSPMALNPKPIAYYQLGDQSVDNGANYLVPNNSLSDFVFDWFGGVNGTLIQVPSTSNFAFGSGGFGVSLWINFNSVSVAKNILDFRTNGAAAAVGSLWFDPTSGVRWYVAPGYKSANIPASSFSINTWYNIVVVNNGSTIYFYLNGNLVDSATDTTVYIAAPLTIGAYSGGSQPALSGKLSNISIFNTALLTADIQTIYNNGSPNDISSLSPVAWYKLNASEIFNSTSTEWSVDNNAYPSVYRSSLNFDGSNDSVDCGNTLGSGYSLISVSSWVNFDNPNANLREEIISKDDGSSNRSFALFKNANSNWATYGTVGLLVNDGTTTSNATVSQADFTPSAGVWYHVVGTWDGSNIKVYIDAVLKKTNAFSASNLDVNTVNVLIGGVSYISSSFFNGQISNTAVWNTALTLTQIETIYNNGTPEASISHSPVSWWKLDNTTTGLLDSGSASNNGTNSGATKYDGFVNALAGESSGMDSSNLVVSDLQQTSGYSPYALDFDGSDQSIQINNMPAINQLTPFTWSFWIYPTRTNDGYEMIYGQGSSIDYFAVNDTKLHFYISGVFETGLGFITPNEWQHVAVTRTIVGNAGNLKLYRNGVPYSGTSNQPQAIGGGVAYIGTWQSSSLYFKGSISNGAIFDVALTDTQMTLLYNQGAPSDLNNFTPKPKNWWQLGSNSSFNTQWTCLDEIGTNNGVSVNMANDDITNGPGYSANGLGSSTIDIVGDAPYSTANGLSENMDVLDRTIDVPG